MLFHLWVFAAFADFLGVFFAGFFLLELPAVELSEVFPGSAMATRFSPTEFIRYFPAVAMSR